MKEKNYILCLVLFHCFAYLYQSIACNTSYVALQRGTEGYCAKCDTTCKTCSNEGMNNCIQCPNDFIFNQNTSYCIPPDSSQIVTVESSYKFVGFSAGTNWFGGSPFTHATYGPTVYRLSAGQSQLYKVFTLNPSHYQLRILVSVWILDDKYTDNTNTTKVTSTDSDYININFYETGVATPYKTIPINNIPVAAGVVTPVDPNRFKIYPTNWRAKNIDQTFADITGRTSAKISFTSNRPDFGIREFIFIQYLCNQTACSLCDGPTNSSCTACTSSNRELPTATSKECLCKSPTGFFKHPDFDYCVNPCPNRLDGQYYGDPITKNCVLSCSDPTYYTDPAIGKCWAGCTDTISLGSLARYLYKDNRNMRCVTVCPTTEPYFNFENRTCYNTCPGGKFQNDLNMECVTDCPDTGPIPLFGYNGRCVEECIGADNWGDFITNRCTSICSSGPNGQKYFQDNSTKRNLCVQVCPFPQYFGDDITNVSQPYCQEICPDGYYGDYLSPRHCVSQCSQGTTTKYFGLKVSSRQCVKVCPQGSWGETTDFTCVLTAAECDLDNNKYADNHTWLCVAKGACSKGRYTLDSTYSCVITCPAGTYADDLTKHCQLGCSGIYFADPGINKCVQVCQTQGLYADVFSSNRCVSECSQTGLPNPPGPTPFRDITTKTCVRICPTDKKLFADTLAKQCVYNCTPTTYAYDTGVAGFNKTCLAKCPSPYFADNTTGYGVCVLKCPQDPILFGDVIGTDRICVPVCQATMFGDQNPAGQRFCRSTCTVGWFAQDDSLRRCVTRCNATTFGHNQVCVIPQSCPTNWVGDPSTSRCVSLCPATQGTFSDLNGSRLCVSKCPVIGVVKYFADPTLRWCVDTCNASHLLFGNNKTLTCQTKCLDTDSYADAQHPNRFCSQWCTDVGATKYYRNNYTKICVISANCPTNYFADNNTKTCVAKCPIINTIQQTWGHVATKKCVTSCYGTLWGDASTGIPLCVSQCPSVPAKWSNNGDMTCVTICPSPLYGQDFPKTTRACLTDCLIVTDTDLGETFQTFAFDTTRRCLRNCPSGTFSDYTTRKCYPSPSQCTFGWGDPFNNSCVHRCTGPTPWDTFGDNDTDLCTTFCTNGSFADSHTGTRICVAVCPGTYDTFGNRTNAFDTFADQFTRRCETFCMTPGYFADWQSHRCQSRCTGDLATKTPTYSNNVNKRCVISLACPIIPDKLFGDNRTRTCATKCYFDVSVTEWADNLTRSCIPQCYHINNTAVYAYDTRFYGDLSTGIPMCIIRCPTAPRFFGYNITNKCVSLCPDGTFGDQVNNRSCTADCYEWNNVIYYAQITQRLCVSYCEDGTFANWRTRRCQTVPTGCHTTQYANDGNNSCVALCPEYMNYFGDPSTKRCVKTCPNLVSAVVGAGINQQPGYLYADYSTRLCVRTCPASDGLRGTFGDNFTTTCVQRCPAGSYGDPLTVNRRCVAVCTLQSFADPLTMLCVSKCPSSPPYFGYRVNWTCVNSCPASLWADSVSRQCISICPAGSFRLTSFRRQCVNVCPSNPDLYADSDSKNCQLTCTLGKYADPTDRVCKSSCLPLFRYNLRCVALCPSGYYANSTGDCVLPGSCDAIVPYAQNRTTKCVATCTGGSFGDSNSRYCIAVCPDGWYGNGNICTQTCTGSTSLSTITQTCVSACPKFTYHENNTCKNQCQTGFANDLLGTCHTACPLTPIRLFADTLSFDCVEICRTGYVRDQNTLVTGKCVTNINGCQEHNSLVYFSDEITGYCVRKCSLGYWGNLLNRTCLPECFTGQYGYQSATERTCYQPTYLPLSAPILFADPQSRQFVPVCQTTPKLYFGDRVLNLCVQVCAIHSTIQYYGDPNTRQCESTCTNTTFYTADRLKDKCVLKCTLGTFRFNNTAEPICQSICPQGFADPSTRVCVAQCPIQADTFGHHDTSTNERVCVNPCPSGFFADPVTRQCKTFCISPYYADNTTRTCVKYCVDSFADNSNRRCMDKCYSVGFPSADNSTNKCVLLCPSSPDYYNQNNVCVFYCTQANYFADSSTRQCVSRCPNVTASPSYFSYGDQTIGRCVKKCPQTYWGDNSTNKCLKTCPIDSFADNDTRLCVLDCPRNQSIYADPFLHMCAYTCSNGYFGSQVSQKCIQTCQNGATQATKYWGNPLTTLCVNVCPSSIYSYGQNVTRKCALSCNPHANFGFADNFSRICRNKCQDTIVPQTFADPTTSSCVQICPQGYYAQNTTNTCVQVCLTGYADDYSRYCVAKCPDDPETYGQVNANGNRICVYECLNGKFSNNDTNICDVKCPTVPDFFGDPHLGRCVHFCTQGSYAENDTRKCLSGCPLNSYADNFTRRCTQFCPTATQGTYRDTTNNKCVHVCPDLWWAQNTSNICVSDCPKYVNLTQSYQDNISKFCVAQCPFPYYGKNNTHECILQCSPAGLRTLFGHNQGRVCVALLDCFPVGIKKYYADIISGTCVQVCPLTLWADDVTWTCVSDCDPIVKNQYRNLNNQKCQLLCPSDPDQYADDLSGNCVSKCPDGSYAHSYTGFRQCVPSCQPYSLYADNQTNRCVSTCPTDPFMYADTLIWKCVYKCSSFYFADNKTQTCVQTCPAQWQLFGETTDYTCVQLCPASYYADVLDNRKCKMQCTSPRFADKYTSTCVVNCKDIRKYYYEDTSTGTGICVEVCPSDSYGYNTDQKCKYKHVNLSSSCPDPFFADRVSKRCVKLCPADSYADDMTKYCESGCTGTYFADKATRKCQTLCSDNFYSFVVSATNHTCVQFCPLNWYAQNSSRSCVQLCSTLFRLQTTRTCEAYCPEPYFKFIDALECRTSCYPLYADGASRQCRPTCLSPDFGNPLTNKCDDLCPENYYGRTNGRICSLTCEEGTFADPSTRLCVTSCPQYPLLFADDAINECVQVCQTGYGYQVNRTCLSSCPNSTVTDSNSNIITVIYLRDDSNNLCVLHCINQEISFADYTQNYCTQRCPAGKFANNFTKECVPECPTVPNDTFAQNSSNICMEQCPIETFGSSQNLYCVADCWWPNFEDQTTRLCVQTCPDEYFAQNQTAICVKKCRVNTYADKTTRRCVANCPIVHELFKYDQEWECVSQCPPTFYADDTTRKCKKFCNEVGMYAYELTRECVRQCPVPYRGFDLNKTCILSCPYLYFYNITRNKCTKCPIQCLSCTGPTSCLVCAAGYNLFNGMCDISCQPSNGVITYSDPQGICVRTCPFTWYGDNLSYSCTKTCPLKQYGSNDTQLCENCPQTCAVCSSKTDCSVCQSSATLAIDKMCYKDCNLTHKYYYNTTCFNICPDGTYLTYTNVHCGVCSTNCATCSQSATKCLTCNGKYFFNDTCMTQCPSEYFGNTQFVCQLCTNETRQCKKPLTFSTQVIVQNFQYVILLKFNQNVDIQKQIRDVLRIRLKVQRRLLSVTNLINDGIQFTYQILPDGTIKIYLILDQSLSTPQFTIEFIDPTAIKSLDGGGTLQTSEANFIIEKVEYYSPETGIKAQTNTAARFAVIFVLLLYAVSFFWTDAAIKPLQFIQLALLHATLNIVIPPSLHFYLIEFKRSLISFVPNIFGSRLEPDKVYHASSLKVIDIFTDYDFLRHLGQIFFFLAVFAVMWLIFCLLSNKRLISDKLWHHMFDDIFKRRFKFMAINDIFSLFYVPIMWFTISQFADLAGTAQASYSNMNAAFTIIFLIAALALPIIWFVMWLKYQQTKFQQECSFMCKRVKKIELSYEIYEQAQQSEQKLKSQKSQQIVQHVSGVQFKNSKFQLQTVITYVYLFLMNVWLVALYEKPIAQLVMLLLTNLVYVLYIVYYRPYVNIVNTVIISLMVSTLLLIESYMVYFSVNDKNMNSDRKTQIIQPLIILLSAIYVLMIFWTIWRVIYDGMDIWNYFKKTQFYLVYGDPDHTVDQQVSQTYQKFQKKAQNIEYQVGDQIVQKISKQVNEHGESIIRVRKKILRKKKKYQVAGRKKNMQREQIQNESSQNNSQQEQSKKLTSSNKQSSKSVKESYEQVQEQFIRVNKPTPYEMIKSMEQDLVKSQSSIQKSKTNFKAIDDDVRDDEDEREDQEYSSNRKVLKNSRRNKAKKGRYEDSNEQNKPDRNNNKQQKVIVQVQEVDEEVYDIEDIMVQKQKNEQGKKKVDQDEPFQFISDINDQQVPKSTFEINKVNKNEFQMELLQDQSQKYEFESEYKDLQSQKQSQISYNQEVSNKNENEGLKNHHKQAEKLYDSEILNKESVYEQQNSNSLYKKTSPIKQQQGGRIFDLQQLIEQEQMTKHNKLMFLFDDQDAQQN